MSIHMRATDNPNGKRNTTEAGGERVCVCVCVCRDRMDSAGGPGMVNCQVGEHSFWVSPSSLPKSELWSAGCESADPSSSTSTPEEGTLNM